MNSSSNNNNIIYAQDILISLASALPRNLLIEGTEDNINFLFKLSKEKEQLKKLYKTAEKKGINLPIRLKFFTAKAGRASSPIPVNSLEEVNWENVRRIDFVSELILDCDVESPKDQYISVVLTTK